MQPFFSGYNAVRKAFDRQVVENKKTIRKILFGQSAPAPADYLSSVAETKRFLENYVADLEFREALSKNPGKAALERGLKMDPEKIRFLWDASYAFWALSSFQPLTHEVLRYRAFMQEKLLHRSLLQEIQCVPKHPAQKLWRERQMNRCLSELGPDAARAMIFTPIAVELSKGCSVGCWFCGLSSGKKEA